MKVVTMIPARMGSTRVKNKNIRLLDSKPLVQHIIEAAKSSSLTGDIYLNSESDIFKEIAEQNGIKFYKRDSKLSTDDATNDDFSLDFINNVGCDVLLQLLPTSPFITSEEIDSFLKEMFESGSETMISTTNIQIEALFDTNPINFDQKSQTPPSQMLTPVKAYACGIMGWNCDKFRENMDKFGAGYHGGDGSIGFYELKGYSTVDIVEKSMGRPLEVTSVFEVDNSWVYELNEFVEAIKGGEIRNGTLNDALQIMNLIEDIYATNLRR